MIEVTSQESVNTKAPVITVIGIGGGGNNAVNRMVSAGMENVNFIAVNTDYQVLEDSLAERKIQIGRKLTAGMGAGADPAVGASSAEENEEDIIEAIHGTTMAILTCGLGGGTGTGAIPVTARICREQKILTVAVVTMPFSFEGVPQHEVAQKGLDELRENTDLLLVIPNDKLLQICEDDFYLEDAFLTADNVLRHTIEGITGIIFGRGVVNLDFNDIRTTITNSGLGHLGIGTVKKDGSIMDAIKQAINSPLLDTDISTASSILINTSGRLKTQDLNGALSYIREIARPDIRIHWGTVSYKDTEDMIKVTIIATGLSEKTSESRPKQAEYNDNSLNVLLSRYSKADRLSSGSRTRFSSERITNLTDTDNTNEPEDTTLRIPKFIYRQSIARNTSGAAAKKHS